MVYSHPARFDVDGRLSRSMIRPNKILFDLSSEFLCPNGFCKWNMQCNWIIGVDHLNMLANKTVFVYKIHIAWVRHSFV